MTPHYADDHLTIWLGDVRAVLDELRASSIDCVVTSPPYFGLRDYGEKGQIGIEDTVDEYVAAMVDVFRDVRRVLREDGTLWLNLGDSYAGSWGAQSRRVADSDDKSWHGSQIKNHPRRTANTGSLRTAGVKPKDLYGVPWRVAFALQSDGWYLRSDIIWSKPNPMPESVTDRPTKSHEYLFLLSKSPRYYFDAEAVREDGKDWSTGGPGTGIKPTTHYHPSNGGNEGLAGIAGRYKAGEQAAGRNIRSVWTVATQPYPGAHFATFPEKLVEPMVLAGCPVGGVVLDPFGGSGTVAVVAQRLGRRAVLIDLSPEYVDQMIRRVGAARGAGQGPAVDMPVPFAPDGLWSEVPQ